MARDYGDRGSTEPKDDSVDRDESCDRLRENGEVGEGERHRYGHCDRADDSKFLFGRQGKTVDERHGSSSFHLVRCYEFELILFSAWAIGMLFTLAGRMPAGHSRLGTIAMVNCVVAGYALAPNLVGALVVIVRRARDRGPSHAR